VPELLKVLPFLLRSQKMETGSAASNLGRDLEQMSTCSALYLQYQEYQQYGRWIDQGAN
jgi:hypothetical protein